MISSVAPALLSASTIAGSVVGIVICYPHVAPPGAPGGAPRKTSAKLAVSFWDYLGSRLAIPAAAIIPPLRELILASARHPEPPSG
jgi:hypothetical protein